MNANKYLCQIRFAVVQGETAQFFGFIFHPLAQNIQLQNKTRSSSNNFMHNFSNFDN